MPQKKKSDKSKKTRQPEQEQLPGYGFNWRTIIWIFLGMMIAYYAFQTYQSRNVVQLDYTTFKEQIASDNIYKITMQKDKITGEFVHEYTPKDAPGEKAPSYTRFKTVKPPLEDKELLPMLEKRDVTIDARPSDDSGLGAILWLLLPWLLIIGFFLYMRNRMQNQMQGGGMGGMFGFGKSKAQRFDKSTDNESYDDVAGLENSKIELMEIVTYLKEPAKFKKLGATMPKGILLVGPPGTGKTLLARATAGEADVPFFSISGSEFIEMFVGVGASRVRDMFNTAKKESPSIIFIDELDSIGRARGTGVGGGHDEREQTLNQILSEMDGFSSKEAVVVMAATNRPDVLDSALTRPGRFDRQVTLDMPQKKAREKILAIHTRKIPLDRNVDLEKIAGMTVGFAGADLKNLANEAALHAGREDRERVTQDDFFQARDKIMMGTKREEKMTEEDRKIIAYHEAGHTLVAAKTPKADPLQKVTIIPRGRALGATEQIPEQDRYNVSRQYLLGRIAVMLGGRSAEKLVFDDLTTGAANDLKQSTQIARRMITQWGMSEKLGAATFAMEEEHVFLGKDISQPKHFSEHTNQIIDEEIQAIINKMEEKAAGILTENRDILDRLAEALIEKETLEKEEISRIIENRETPENTNEEEKSTDES